MEPELPGTGTCATLLTYGGGPTPDCATARRVWRVQLLHDPLQHSREGCLLQHNIALCVLWEMLFLRDIFCSVLYLCGGASNLPRCCDNRWDSSFKTWTNLTKSGCLPNLLHRRYVQRLRSISKTSDLKAMWITVVLCFCYKPPKSWKEFQVLLQTWKQAKAHEEVP